jgi:hypothetical protein
VRFTLASFIPYVIVILSIFLGLCAFLYFRQEGFLFFPGPNDPELRERMRDRRVVIPSDGADIEAWWMTNESAATAVILYFGGNAEDVLYFASTAQQWPVRHVLVANYRGFGETAGRLSEKAAIRMHSRSTTMPPGKSQAIEFSSWGEASVRASRLTWPRGARSQVQSS